MRSIKIFFLNEPSLTELFQCSYFSEKKARYAEFYASGFSESDLEVVINSGWRKFGYYFFKPECDNCKECVPLRIPVSSFVPGRSQKKLLNLNTDITVDFSNQLNNPELAFSIYKEHSHNRFGKDVNRDEFEFNLCTQSCPSLYSHYYLKNELVAIGFIDCSTDALSSVYFIYKTGLAKRALGNYSILREIQYAEKIGKKYYYLGYYIEKCSRMVYKSRFFPHQILDRETNLWILVIKE